MFYINWRNLIFGKKCLAVLKQIGENSRALSEVADDPILSVWKGIVGWKKLSTTCV